MQINHAPFRLGVAGLSGSGKTTYLARFLLSPRTKATCRFVFDHVGALTVRLGKPAARDVASLLGQIATGWCVFDPRRAFGDDVAAAEWFAGFAFVASGSLPGRKLFVVDELQDLAEKKAGPLLGQVWNRGRNVGLDVAYITQSFGEAARTLVKQTTEAVTFNTSCEASLYRLRKWGFDVDAVQRLPRGSYLARNLMTGGEVAGKVF